MSVRTNWTTPNLVEVAVVNDHREQYGEDDDGETHVALVLMQDQDGMVIEGFDVDDLRKFVERVEAAIDTYEREHADARYDEWLSKAPEGVTPKDVTRE